MCLMNDRLRTPKRHTQRPSVVRCECEPAGLLRGGHTALDERPRDLPICGAVQHTAWHDAAGWLSRLSFEGAPPLCVVVVSP